MEDCCSDNVDSMAFLQISQTAEEFGSVDRTATYRYPKMSKTMVPKVGMMMPDVTPLPTTVVSSSLLSTTPFPHKDVGFMTFEREY